VADGSPTHSSTPVRIESALQFVPKNTDPREFKKLQQQVNCILFVAFYWFYVFIYLFILFIYLEHKFFVTKIQ
jgi:hypothetical protein